TETPLELVAGTLAAAVSGFLAVSFLIRLLRTRTLWPFIWYRLVAGALFVLLLSTVRSCTGARPPAAATWTRRPVYRLHRRPEKETRDAGAGVAGADRDAVGLLLVAGCTAGGPRPQAAAAAA